MKDIIRIIISAYKQVKGHWKVLAKALIVPIVLLFIIDYIPLFFTVSPVSKLLLLFISLVPMTLLAITTHKIILEGEHAVPQWGINSFGKREFKFLFTQIALGLILIPIVLLSLIPIIGSILMLLGIWYVLSRCSLAFPSIAIGEKINLIESWYITKPYQLLMIAAVAVVPLLMGLVEIGLSFLPFGEYIAVFFSIASMVFVVAALSCAYSFIQEKEPK